MRLKNFPEVVKTILKPLPKKDYPVLDTFSFVSVWLQYVMDKSIVSMRDLFQRLNNQGDDGYQSTAQEMIEQNYPWVKWVAGPGKGPAANRNNGAKYATGEWLAFTDDDCLPDPQWLASYGEAIANNKSYLVFEGRTYVDRPRKNLAETSPINESGGYLWSCNFSIQKQLFESLGGFDERFPYAAMEDVDLRLRLT
ncbi:MAG: glycosyltransferase family 2 protein, partial [Dolichospermum sp.]